MEKARVVLFEDDPDWILLIREILEDDGHTVAATARDMDVAELVVSGLPDDCVDVGIVDGNLGAGRLGGSDGRRLTSLLDDRFPSIVMIGLSGSDTVEGAEFSLNKATEAEQISDILSGI